MIITNNTYEDVETAIKGRMPEVINDIQQMLANNCCNDCLSCEFQYLCIREEE